MEDRGRGKRKKQAPDRFMLASDEESAPAPLKQLKIQKGKPLSRTSMETCFTVDNLAFCSHLALSTGTNGEPKKGDPKLSEPKTGDLKKRSSKKKQKPRKRGISSDSDHEGPPAVTDALLLQKRSSEKKQKPRRVMSLSDDSDQERPPAMTDALLLQKHQKSGMDCILAGKSCLP